MSLGFIPVIISIILCEFITQDMSIYIGAGVGLLFSIYSVRHRGTHVPQIILYCTTGMLLLLSVTTLFLVNYCPRFMLPFTLEISAIIPPFIIYLNRGGGGETACCVRQRQSGWPDWYSRFSGWWPLRRWLSPWHLLWCWLSVRKPCGSSLYWNRKCRTDWTECLI